MELYMIDYEYGVAKLYTNSDEWEKRFYELARQCFGIRKSIGEVNLLSVKEDDRIDQIIGEYERLEHNGDTIIWNESGEKIKSEWD